MDSVTKKGFVRINALRWADILVAYALFVMQDYLTDVWKLSFTHAAAIVNFWSGISKVLPVFFLFFVDAVLGNFTMLVISSIAYSVGIGLLTMSTPPVLANSTGTCKEYEPECIGRTQEVLFYTGMALIAVGVAGNLVSVEPFTEEQEEGPTGTCIKIPAFTLIAVVPIVGAIALPYVKPWTLRFGIPAICTLFATLLFLTGWRGPWKYDKVPPEGSPVTNVVRVFVAAAFKMCKPFPLDNRELHRADESDQSESFKRTRFLRCLEKAAIRSNVQDLEESRWRLCAVAQVEEAKIALRMVPMWLTFIICGIVSSIGNTYFVEQASNMNRNIGRWRLPPQILMLVFESAKGPLGFLANRLLGKKTNEGAPGADAQNGIQETGTPAANIPETGTAAAENITKKIRPAIGIGFGMTFSVLCCIVAAVVERRRLGVIRRHGLLDKPDDEIPMNILWLVFQFVLLAGLDSFLESSVAEFYKYQSPPSMKKYLKYFTMGVTGLGFMFSVLSVFVVGRISERGGRPNWFRYTLNKSRLDRYYWVLAALSAVNLLVFAVVAVFYRYRDLEAQSDDADAAGEGEGAGGGGGGGEVYQEGDYECNKCCCCG